MSLSKFLKDRLNEIATGEMPLPTRAQRKRGFQYGPWQRFHADEDGKISFVSVFTVLIMLIFILLVANAGIGVKEKIELQNAADATAYSSALWQARSLNAIATTNHLMGELTAITVILDSFGGEMLGQTSLTTKESENYNKRLDDLREAWAHDSQRITITAKVLGEPVDRHVVKAVIDLLVDDGGDHDAGAAIYDAKLTLKFSAFLALFIKKETNILLEVAAILEETVIFSWAAPICEAIAAPIHVILSKYLADFGIEWAYLEATESIVGFVNANGNTRKGMKVVLKALSTYADSVVGSKVAESLGSSTPFNDSVRKTQQFLKSAHRLRTAETSPSWEKMKLPVVAEEPPLAEESKEGETRKRMGPWGYPRSEWKGDFTSWEMSKIIGPYNDIKREMNNLLGELEGITGPMQDAADAVESGLDSLGISGGVGSINPQIKQALIAFKKVQGLIDGFSEGLPDGPPKHPNCYEENPCINDQLSEDLQLPKFYFEAEPKSQWVRATYPYVDEYRAPIVSFFKKNCKFSDAATYYVNWSNRYTLAASWEIRKNDDDKESSETSKKKNLYAKLKVEVGKLRDRFNKATDDTAEENAGVVNTGKFDAISIALTDLVRKDPLKSEIESFQVEFPWLRSWVQDVLNHKRQSWELGQSVTPSSELDVDPEVVKGLAEEMAIINWLDELLTILEDLLDAFEFGPPHMYVLRGMEPNSKGMSEPWIEDEVLAENLFVVNAIVSRPTPTLMGAIFEQNTPKADRYALASAMVYNANGRNMTSQQPSHQPNTGWDTLNWAPRVRAGEWGDHAPSDSSNRSPWQLTAPNSLTEQNQVKINWQVKLVPITRLQLQRLSELEVSGIDILKSGAIHDAIVH